MHNTADNEVKLNDISLKVKNCADCLLYKNRVCSVFSKGNANANSIWFLGLFYTLMDSKIEKTSTQYSNIFYQFFTGLVYFVLVCSINMGIHKQRT